MSVNATQRPPHVSWGGYRAVPGHVDVPADLEELKVPRTRYLACGNGRSYGDSGLPADGATLIDMRRLDRIIAFDRVSGILRAEAGLTIGALLPVIVEAGWFLPVTPGTQFITLGGALANDVHGKNHHRRGTFGCHVLRFELRRSNGVALVCSRKEREDLFAATIGGMGLTGIVTWIELQLTRAPQADILESRRRVRDLDAMLEALEDADKRHEYSVAWIDSLAPAGQTGRGVLLCGDAAHAVARTASSGRIALHVPFTPPVPVFNAPLLRIANTMKYAMSGNRRTVVPYRRFFYPLDRIGEWNRLYGPRGLRQLQCVVPDIGARATFLRMLEESRGRGHASFLTVLKRFGDIASPGLMSFPRPGCTLTLDFPYQGQATDTLLDDLAAMALAAGGAINVYKHSAISRAAFEASYPRWREAMASADPAATSAFSERLGLHAVCAPPLEAQP